MDLYEYAKSKTLDQESPLASRLRPRTLDEVVGQQHIVGKDKLLYRAIKADKLTSVIFYGPPGTGKTTLAKVIANTTSASFTQINATARRISSFISGISRDFNSKMIDLERSAPFTSKYGSSCSRHRTISACMEKRPFYSLMVPSSTKGRR